jgi:acyl-CoA thioesterase FadM
MPRIKLSEQDTYEFQLPLQIRPQDVNYGGHLGNDNLISMVGAARAYLFHSLHLSELDLGDGETGLIITDMAVNYRAEAFMFDELRFETHIGEIERSSFRMFHRITREGKLIALVETGIVTYNYREKAKAPVPALFLNRIASERQGSPVSKK